MQQNIIESSNTVEHLKGNNSEHKQPCSMLSIMLSSAPAEVEGNKTYQEGCDT